jgi:Trk K+ transport system NAD-binding subunit
MSLDMPSFGDKVRYQVDRFLSWNPFTRFVGLFGLSFILILICAVLAKIVMPAPEDPNDSFDLFEALWWAMTRVADAGTMGDDKGTAVRFVATLATLSGVAVVALLIGLVSSTIGDKIEDLRKGRSPVIDEGHTLILGFNEKVFAILRELREANANLKSAAVVILSESDKEEVENAVRERLGPMGPTRVVVRQGSPFSVHDLRKVGAGRARSLIILAAELSDDDSDDAQDMAAIKTLLALRRIPGALSQNHAVVELLDASRRTVVEQLGAGGVEVVAMAETLSRMMVQTARQNGLAAVYRDLLTYEGSEFYFTPVQNLSGREFREAQWMTQDAVVCGVRRALPGGKAECRLNPPEDFLLQSGDELLVIAEDDDRFSLTASHQANVPDDFTGATPIARQPERMLICGTSPKLADMLGEFDHYVLPGSEAWLMPGEEKERFADFIKDHIGTLKNLKLKFVEGDPTSPEALRKVASPDFAVAMVVADTNRPADEADARTVMSVLLLRDLFRAFREKKPRIISEILDTRTKDLLEQDYGADFVVSAEMTSMLLAQVSQRRELNAVFADLFDSDGNEVYLKRAACYSIVGRTTSWLSVQKVARQRGEVAIGFLKLNGKPVINPKQTESLVFDDDDRVVVIAEDDNEALGDQRGGSLEAPSQPLVDAKPEAKSRSALLPPEPSRAPDSRPVSAGPRVAGPSTMPRPPLPSKPKT